MTTTDLGILVRPIAPWVVAKLIDTTLNRDNTCVSGGRARRTRSPGTARGLTMSDIDFKYLRVAVAMMDEMDTSRAAARLGIGQSAISKQLAALHAALGYPLFVKQGRRMVPTPAGDVFVAEARKALDFAERSVRLSRSAHEQMQVVLHVGKSPYTDPYLITNLLSLRLPYFPNLRVELSSKVSVELSHDLLNGTLDLAFLTGLPETPRITSVLVAQQRFFVAMLESDELAWSMEVTAPQLETKSCVLFDRHVHPYLYDQILRDARPSRAPGTSIHHITTAEEACQFVMRGFGVAILTQAGAWRIAREGITIRPLGVRGVGLATRLACRSDSGERVVSEFVRSFVRVIMSPTNATQLSLGLAG